MKTIGLCRFSYLGLGGFKLEHEDLEARAAHLYQPARMEERFRLFETITLPSIAGQTDPDFTMVIATGDSLPPVYLERLLSLTEPLDNVAVQTFPPRQHRGVMGWAINQARGHAKSACLQFRLDDDDAMAVSFVERFKAAARLLRPLWQEQGMTTVDFNRGYTYRADADGLHLLADRYPYTAIAMGVIVPPGSRATIMKYGHQNLWKETPTLTLPGGDMYLRGHNGFNDSRAKGRGSELPFAPVTAEQAAHLQESFNISNAAVKAAFAGSDSSPDPQPAPGTG
jgi:hypothetical protein